MLTGRMFFSRPFSTLALRYKYRPVGIL